MTAHHYTLKGDEYQLLDENLQETPGVFKPGDQITLTYNHRNELTNITINGKQHTDPIREDELTTIMLLAQPQ